MQGYLATFILNKCIFWKPLSWAIIHSIFTIELRLMCLICTMMLLCQRIQYSDHVRVHAATSRPALGLWHFYLGKRIGEDRPLLLCYTRVPFSLKKVNEKENPKRSWGEPSMDLRGPSPRWRPATKETESGRWHAFQYLREKSPLACIYPGGEAERVYCSHGSSNRKWLLITEIETSRD
jgi:hypothetical protein